MREKIGFSNKDTKEEFERKCFLFLEIFLEEKGQHLYEAEPPKKGYVEVVKHFVSEYIPNKTIVNFMEILLLKQFNGIFKKNNKEQS